MQNRYVILTFLFTLSVSAARSQDIDYTATDNWWAHPDTKDYADYTPSGPYRDEQGSAKADVFYIHPTTYYRGFRPNAQLHNSSVARLTKVVILNQASVFNGSCRVYAPKYRQVILKQFLLKEDTSKVQYFEVAYADIRRAFDAYMDNWNKGRPIIIAGHSQGSYLAQRLLADYFEGKPLHHQLIAAFVPGYPYPAAAFDREDKYLHPSAYPDDIGCVVTWRTVSDKYNDPLEPGLMGFANGRHHFITDQDSLICTNPLSWYTNDEAVPNDSNPGSMLSVTRPGRMPEPDRGVCGAAINDGKVVVKQLRDHSFNNTGGNYHIYDYNLYWVSIRENIALRVKHYMDVNH